MLPILVLRQAVLLRIKPFQILRTRCIITCAVLGVCGMLLPSFYLLTFIQCSSIIGCRETKDSLYLAIVNNGDF